MVGVGIEAAGLSGHEACSNVGPAQRGRQSCAMIALTEDGAPSTRCGSRGKT
jgi:hypothetical protein